MKNLIVTDSKIHGKGLFATKTIPWGVKIIQYKGEFIDDKEALLRLKKGAEYIFEVGKNKNIDGAVRGNNARFINHSRTKPNCVVLREKGKIWIIAGIEGIKKGEELTFDYGSDYFPTKK